MLETYPLYKGKNKMNNYDQSECQFKGNFLIYKENERDLNENLKKILDRFGAFFKTIPSNMPVQVKVRVYIIKASIFNPIRAQCNSYLSLQIDEVVHETLEDIKYNTVEPIFGNFFEFDVKFPFGSQLTVSIKDYLLGTKSLIGKTTIDLEDRFYSNCYASCGIPQKYETSGYNCWRDSLLPSQILVKLCKQWRIQSPDYSSANVLSMVDINGISKIYKIYEKASPASYSVKADTSKKTDNNLMKSISNLNSLLNEPNDPKLIKENLALMALNDWESLTGFALIPEHVETRSLYNSDTPELEQGKIEMWVDIFPYDSISSMNTIVSSTNNISNVANNNNNSTHHTFKPVDVSVRKPKKFQLRVIIYNTKDVILDDVNLVTGEKTSDIYVKGFLCDQKENSQKTDTHFRSLTGEGNFNWRFIWDFDYLPAEEMIVYKHKDMFSLLQTKAEKRMEPLITLQCWDADIVSADDNLGNIQLNLSRLIRGAKSPSACKLSMLTNKNRAKINLFKEKRHRGWWPFFSFDPVKNTTKLTVSIFSFFTFISMKYVKSKAIM
jgi:otoferlin